MQRHNVEAAELFAGLKPSNPELVSEALLEDYTRTSVVTGRGPSESTPLLARRRRTPKSSNLFAYV